MTVKYPIWIDKGGTDWTYEAVVDCCRFGDDNSLHSWHVTEPLPVPLCIEPVEYVSKRKQLCRKHFEEVKKRCTVRFEEFS